MADLRRETAHGIAVSLVYTPPRWRNKGYASSCVASLTKRVLDNGKDFAAFLPSSPIQPQQHLSENRLWRNLRRR
jgi:predicted GNAT family acetyltransferase